MNGSVLSQPPRLTPRTLSLAKSKDSLSPGDQLQKVSESTDPPQRTKEDVELSPLAASGGADVERVGGVVAPVTAKVVDVPEGIGAVGIEDRRAVGAKEGNNLGRDGGGRG